MGINKQNNTKFFKPLTRYLNIMPLTINNMPYHHALVSQREQSEFIII